MIQRVKGNKKDTLYGNSRRVEVYTTEWTSNGKHIIEYGYRHSDERFTRLLKPSYKISIHKSYRDHGKVKKKQWVICTMGWYDLVSDCEYTDHTLGRELDGKLVEMGIDEDELRDMIYDKLDLLIGDAEAEWTQTEEYKETQRQNEILRKYRIHKEKFESEYGNNTYDRCYDVFGKLRNEGYIEELKEAKKQREEYERRSREESRKTYEDFFKNGGYSSFTGEEDTPSIKSEDKAKFKKIYRVCAAKFHPDVYNDNGEMMKFLNQMKEKWGI